MYPYLLWNVAGDRPDQVWCADITYLPLPKGFVYLVAVMDWHSRRVLSWRLSNSLSADFCAEALREALDRFFRYYNGQRPHGTLGYHTPGEVHRGQMQWNPNSARSPSNPAAPTNSRKSILAAGGPPAEEGPGGPGKTKFIQP